MSGHSVDALQAALYARLTGDATLMTLIEGVFDRVGLCSTYPYVTIGDIQALDWGTHTFEGMEHQVTIHTWNRDVSGRRPTRAVMKRVYDLLHEESLVIAGGVVVLMRFDNLDQVELDPDGETYHGVQRFRVLTREA